MPVFYSKVYTTGANIAASASSAENYISEADQYASGPFDKITITNRDVVTLRINLDGNSDNSIIVQPGIDKSNVFTDLAYRTFTITNLDSTNTHTAGKVSILVENTRFPRRH